MVAVCTADVASVTPVALSATVACSGASVLLLTMAASCALSPTTKKRGVTGRMSSGLVETKSTVPSPTRVSFVTPTPRITHVVRLSGSLTVTCALPSLSVTTLAFQ